MSADNEIEILRAELTALRADLAAAKEELAAERNLHGQTRVVVEELNTICNDLRNAGQPQFIRSEAIRLLREDQAQLRADLAAKEAAWKPIETAPKDETHILIYRPQRNAAFIGWWNPDQYSKKPRPYWSSASVWGVSGDREAAPSHWMPLPASPALASRADKGGAR